MKPVLKVTNESTITSVNGMVKNCSKRHFLPPKTYKLFEASNQDSQRNLFIAISVGASPKEPELLKKTLEMAYKLCPQQIIVMVADTLNKYNEFVFGSRSLKISQNRKDSPAERRAYRLGSVYVDAIESSLLFSTSPIKIIRWKDVLTQQYSSWVSEYNKEYQENYIFKEIIDTIAKNFINKRNNKVNVTSERHNAIVRYILEELPSLTKGVEFNGIIYNSYLHPFKTSFPNRGNPISDLAIKIIKDHNFQSLRERLGGTAVENMIDLEFVEIH